MQLAVNTRSSFQNNLTDNSTSFLELQFTRYKPKEISNSYLSNYQIAAKFTLDIFAKALKINTTT